MNGENVGIEIDTDAMLSGWMIGAAVLFAGAVAMACWMFRTGSKSPFSWDKVGT